MKSRAPWVVLLVVGVLAFIATIAGWMADLLRWFNALFTIHSDQALGFLGILLAIYALIRIIPPFNEP